MAERTLRTYQLRRVLERLRRDAGLTLAEASAGTEGDISVTSLSRYESGASVPNALAVRSLLVAYGIDGPQMDGLLRLAREARQRSPWHPYRDALPTWFHFYADLEGNASEVHTFEASLIPGFFQTREYAHALLSLAPSPSEVDKRLEARMLRSERVTSDEAPKVEAILTEGALRRRVSDRDDVSTGQLQHLLELQRRSNVSIRIMPAETPHPGDRSFILLRLPAPEDLQIAYEEYLDGALYPDDPDEVGKYWDTYSHLRQLALSEKDSTAFIRSVNP